MPERLHHVNQDTSEYSRHRYGGCEVKYGSENQRSVPECSSRGEFDKILRNDESIKLPRRTPFEMFLENDGPYSRKLYGPLKNEKFINSHMDGRIGKVVMKNVICRKSEPSNVESSSSSSEFDGMSVKKGLLWQQRDSLFSRYKANENVNTIRIIFKKLFTEFIKDKKI